MWWDYCQEVQCRVGDRDVQDIIVISTHHFVCECVCVCVCVCDEDEERETGHVTL